MKLNYAGFSFLAAVAVGLTACHSSRPQIEPTSQLAQVQINELGTDDYERYEFALIPQDDDGTEISRQSFPKGHEKIEATVVPGAYRVILDYFDGQQKIYSADYCAGADSNNQINLEPGLNQRSINICNKDKTKLEPEADVVIKPVIPHKSGDEQTPDGWELVWSDEFNETGFPKASHWGYDVGTGPNGWGNQELQYYTQNRPENARVKDGKLIITARKESYEGSAYTSARLVTKETGTWRYGRIDVRARLPRGRGTWPAIWLLPVDNTYGGWPKSGEIDVMEHVGYDQGTVHATVHTEAYNHIKGTQVGKSIQVADASDRFHTYSLIWDAQKIQVFLDDEPEPFFTYRNDKGGGSAAWPFDQPFYLLLNIAVGGSWGGAEGVDDTIFPQSMAVDYVRVYKRK
jgi:beta-glucanase (GH16 family)